MNSFFDSNYHDIITVNFCCSQPSPCYSFSGNHCQFSHPSLLHWKSSEKMISSLNTRKIRSIKVFDSFELTKVVALPKLVSGHYIEMFPRGSLITGWDSRSVFPSSDLLTLFWAKDFLLIQSLKNIRNKAFRSLNYDNVVLIQPKTKSVLHCLRNLWTVVKLNYYSTRSFDFFCFHIHICMYI